MRKTLSLPMGSVGDAWMPTPKELETKIKMVRWPGLKNLWASIKKGDTAGGEPHIGCRTPILR